ncbi:MAG TPA: hypothetical protein VHG52_10105, partial [Thermomicrobiales bacterium]|nr:hypothetical protein [Thermomicrobiales bacterium]
DFGRVFAAGITVEAAARNGAEVVAQEYLRLPPAPFPDPAPPPSDAAHDPAYYTNLHDMAARTVCRELRRLPNSGYDQASDTCADVVVLACIHDGADSACATPPSGVASPASMPDCTEMTPVPVPTQNAETPSMRYVEVRVCYRFTTIINLTDLSLPFGWGISVGDIHLQRDRTFTVADW